MAQMKWWKLVQRKQSESATEGVNGKMSNGLPKEWTEQQINEKRHEQGKEWKDEDINWEIKEREQRWTGKELSREQRVRHKNGETDEELGACVNGWKHERVTGWTVWENEWMVEGENSSRMNG